MRIRGVASILLDYTRAFIEWDLPNLGIDVSLSRMRKFWTMLKQSLLVRKLAPYFANVGKRLGKRWAHVASL